MYLWAFGYRLTKIKILAIWSKSYALENINQNSSDFVKFKDKDKLTKGDYFLLLMPATTDNDATINQDVVEKKEDLGGWSSPTLLYQAAVAHQDPTLLGQRTCRLAERVLHSFNALGVLPV